MTPAEEALCDRADAGDERATRRLLDLAIPCPECHAPAETWCTGTQLADDGCPGTHLPRRIKQLCIERRPDLLDPPS